MGLLNSPLKPMFLARTLEPFGADIIVRRIEKVQLVGRNGELDDRSHNKMQDCSCCTWDFMLAP